MNVEHGLVLHDSHPAFGVCVSSTNRLQPSLNGQVVICMNWSGEEEDEPKSYLSFMFSNLYNWILFSSQPDTVDNKISLFSRILCSFRLTGLCSTFLPNSKLTANYRISNMIAFYSIQTSQLITETFLQIFRRVKEWRRKFFNQIANFWIDWVNHRSRGVTKVRR